MSEATTENKKSALALFLESVKDKKPTKEDKKNAGTAFKNFIAKKEAALKALTDLEKEESEVTKAMLTAYGTQKVTVGGIDYAPSSRDERLFYKKMSGGSVEI